MKTQNHVRRGALLWLALLATAACSRGGAPATSITGTALGDGPVVGNVTLTDASSPAQRRTVQTTSRGTFAIDVAGAVAPYLLKVEGRDGSGPRVLYGIADGHHPLDVNPMTNASYLAAAGSPGAAHAFEDDSQGGRSQTFRGTVRLLNQLKTVLAPLLQRYAIANPFTDTAQVRLLLVDVRFSVSGQVLTVLNIATGATIYTASLSDLAGGTFAAENMPAGTCTGGGSGGGGGGGSDGATLYAASCQSCHGPLASSDVSGASASSITGAIASVSSMRGISLSANQISAIAGALAGSGGGGGGGGGSGGAALYAASCQSCHGPLASSRVRGASAGNIREAIAENEGGMGVLSSLTSTQISAIAAALGGGGGGGEEDRAIRESEGGEDDDGGTGGGGVGACGTPCTYTYGDWSACMDGSQSRTVLTTTPTGCTGTPVLTQTCTTGGAGVCTAYTYGPFGACVGGTQTRAVTSALPAGCTDQTTTPPVLTQACTAGIDGDGALRLELPGLPRPDRRRGHLSTPISLPTSAAAINGAGMAQGLECRPGHRRGRGHQRGQRQ